MTGSPADIRGLVYALVNPHSNEEYVRDQQLLTDLFKEPGFFIALQELAGDRSLPQAQRLLASVITGRELKTKWRSKLLVPETRKPEIRQRLFTFLEEPDSTIARPQLGLLAAIGRIELPRHFPNLPQLLLNPLLTCLSHISATAGPSQSSSTTGVVLLNTLWTINALVKEWRTVKLTAGQEVMKSLEEVFTEPVRQVMDIWSEMERNNGADPVLSEAGRYAFKILARFGTWHWSKAKSLQTEAALHNVATLVAHSVHHAPIVQEHRLRLISGPQTPEWSKQLKSQIKYIRAVGKWWRAMLAVDPKGFSHVPQVIQGVAWWWNASSGVAAGAEGTVANDDSDDVPYPKRFILLGLLLFKDILPILAHDHRDVFNQQFILNAFHLLLDKLLPLTSTDLEGLEDEPEEWLIGESNDSEAWSFEFRPCAERVLIALNNACRNLPPEERVLEIEMLKIFTEAEAVAPNDLVTILRREAVYCALGRLSRAMHVHGGINFEQFLQRCVTWLPQHVPLHRILKRRLAWLIGEWVSADEESARLPIVWQVLLHLLTERSDTTDMAVQLSTATAIKECVDLWDLDIAYFLPYLKQTTEALINLIGEASTLDGKRMVNEAIGVIIERTGDNILPYISTLAQSIPALWHSASGLDGEWLFKASLVVLTTRLVNAAKDSSGHLMGLVIPLIEESLQPPAKDFFEEDGLALWQAGLYNAATPYQPTPESGLIRLLPGLLAVLSQNMDLLSTTLPLLDSYLLLDAPAIIQSTGGSVCATLMQALNASAKNADAVRRILTTLSLLIRTAPLPPLAQHLLDSGIFQHILTALEDDKASGLILASYLDILSRIAMIDPNIFLQMIAESARRAGKSEEKTLEEALDALWRNFDYVGEARMRKAVAMGAGALLTTGNHHCLERLDGEFLNIFLDVLGEVQAGSDDQSGKETVVKSWRDEHSVQWSDIDGTPEGLRRTQLEDSDPAYAVPLRGYVVDVLTRAQAVGLGPYWAKADAGAKHSLEKFLA